jgi:hypothetical protein
MTEYLNLVLFIVVCFLIYMVFRNFNYNPMLLEGMQNNSKSSEIGVGVAGNAASYAASLKATSIKLQDSFLISKYKSDYESAIINLDDLINNLMLKTALNVDQSKPEESITKLAKMQQAKVALNSVMKFVDSE